MGPIDRKDLPGIEFYLFSALISAVLSNRWDGLLIFQRYLDISNRCDGAFLMFSAFQQKNSLEASYVSIEGRRQVDSSLRVNYFMLLNCSLILVTQQSDVLAKQQPSTRVVVLETVALLTPISIVAIHLEPTYRSNTHMQMQHTTCATTKKRRKKQDKSRRRSSTSNQSHGRHWSGGARQELDRHRLMNRANNNSAHALVFSNSCLHSAVHTIHTRVSLTRLPCICIYAWDQD